MAQTLVILQRGADRAAFLRDLAAAGYAWTEVTGLRRHLIVDGVSPAAFTLRDHPAVKRAVDGEERGHSADTQSITLDAHLFNGSWALPRIVRRTAPWNVDHLQHPFQTYYRAIRDGTGVDIYNIDSGVRKTQDEFGGRVTTIHGADADLNGHGTQTASASCGATTGPARGSLLWAVQVLDASGSAAVSTIATGMGAALTHYQGRSGTNRPAVANISITASTGLSEAAEDMIDAGMVVVAAAGNSMVDLATVTVEPAEVADVICVGGSGMADLPYFNSSHGTNYGTAIDIVAPSQIVLTASPDADTGYYQSWGTSFGCGFASGVVACMLTGQSRLADRTAVQAVVSALMSAATTGKLRGAFGITLPDRLLYLDPDAA